MAAASRRWRNGKFIDNLGYYNPNPSGQDKKLVLDMTKVQDWVRKGAQPSDRVKTLIKLAETSAS